VPAWGRVPTQRGSGILNVAAGDDGPTEGPRRTRRVRHLARLARRLRIVTSPKVVSTDRLGLPADSARFRSEWVLVMSIAQISPAMRGLPASRQDRLTTNPRVFPPRSV